ncbi:SGNH/GDSL hydrolase family protein [Flavobacterium silvaticum]|uniref:SGNH/GDSL hydrolase family protein n=1 Tax=Flavobacterium silvaticum TaxID=1852020 RepID=A0A972FM02_9FLAO|nr:SGNH/GDSL hydrolase family protein [Flavobacterium silvaticum]NMH28524.1 SGNH/GDSL hydrolase family protein [Flavobacterium silvaticum]
MKRLTALLLFVTIFAACSSSDEPRPTSQNPVVTDPTDDTTENPIPEEPIETGAIKYMALGDSYTVGQNVCSACSFPAQLEVAIEAHITGGVQTDMIATTGWTTTNLIDAINAANPAQDYNLVTLLIGVNNQYQSKPFSLYETEFPQLVNKAIQLAGNDMNNVIVVSIPDYAYTPYGSSLPGTMMTITTQIAQYNAFASNYCQTHGIVFVNITDITQNGLNNPYLVASDGLHPSEVAYALFVERILPVALQTLP